MQLIVNLTVLCVIFVGCQGIYQESPCSAVGGMCALDTNCPNGYPDPAPLCPTQPDNIQCCRPIKQEAPCAAVGGVCALNTNCPNGTPDPAPLCPTQPDNIQCCRPNTGAPVSGDSCLRCICERESKCSAIGCNMDVGSLSCGFFQIKLPYYQDCGEPGGEGEDAWKTCANDYDCASTCVKNYIQRYASSCPGVCACQQMARLHNGGPNGCKVSDTVGYWNAIQSCCGCQ